MQPLSPTVSYKCPGTPGSSLPPGCNHLPGEAPPSQPCILQAQSPCQVTPNQAQSQSHAHSSLLPLSLPSRARPRVSGTKTQHPLFPSTLLPPPPGAQPLCPPAAEPEWQSRQSSGDTGAQAAGGSGGRTHGSGRGKSSSFRAPGKGHGQVSA